MKKLGQIVIILITSLVVFLTGTGVTIMSYCCTTCAEQTLVITEPHVCCSVNEEVEVETTCCSMTKYHDSAKSSHGISNLDHCKASRLSFDANNVSFKPQLSNPFVWITDNSFLTSVRFDLNDLNQYVNYTSFTPPPKILPRAYLSLLRILII